MRMLAPMLCFLLGLSILPVLAISRDGTLPVNMEGTAFEPNNQGTTTVTKISFDDQDLHDRLADVVCGLSGNQVVRDLAGGNVRIGDKDFKVIGTCKDGRKYEVIMVAGGSRTSLSGVVHDQSGEVNFKGTIAISGKTYRFDLK